VRTRLHLEGAGELEDHLVGFLDVVEKRGLKVLEYHYSREAFGNEVLEFGHSTLVIRFVKDRDEIHVDVAPRAKRNAWIPLEKALQSIDVHVEWTDLTAMANAFDENYGSLNAAVQESISASPGDK